MSKTPSSLKKPSEASEYHLVGKGRLQLRQSGKHLVLMQGFKDSSVSFKADKFLDQEVEVYIRVSGVAPREKRRRSPRIGVLSAERAYSE